MVAVWDGHQWGLEDRAKHPAPAQPTPTARDAALHAMRAHRPSSDPFVVARQAQERTVTLAARVEALEVIVVDLEARIRALEAQPTPTPGGDVRQ